MIRSGSPLTKHRLLSICVPITLVATVGGFLSPALWLVSVGSGAVAFISSFKMERPGKRFAVTCLATALIGTSVGGWLCEDQTALYRFDLALIGCVTGVASGAFTLCVTQIVWRLRTLGKRSMPLR